MLIESLYTTSSSENKLNKLFLTLLNSEKMLKEVFLALQVMKKGP